jgi:hypothetical protein
MVERSWTAGIDDPDFWNRNLRAAMCFNASAVRTYLPITIKKTELILAGRSKAHIFEGIKIAFAAAGTRRDVLDDVQNNRT